MEGICTDKVTAVSMNCGAYHIDLIYGHQIYQGHWMAVPNWEISAVIRDPAMESSKKYNAETMMRVLYRTNKIDANTAKEPGRIIAETLYNTETAELPA